MPAMADRPTSEAERLEGLWSGEFGDAYVDRNLGADEGRRDFWVELLERTEPANALEVGCNTGANLRWVAEALGTDNAAGVDVNDKALELLRDRVPGADVRLASGRELPFASASFDLAFTMGVLIHQPSDQLGAVMAEIVRCSRRYVLCGEYYGEEEEEVPYRGETGALFRRDYGDLYQRDFPELELVDQGFLSRDQGTWDDVTWWLFEKPS